MVKAAERAAAIGATAVQIFSDNPTAWRRREAPPAQIDAFRERLVEHDIRPLAVHGPYLVNLAGGDETFWRRSVETLVRDLRMAARYGASVVTIHIGSHRGSTAAEGIARLSRGVAEVFARLASGPAESSGATAGGSSDEPDEPVAASRDILPRLVLENSAGGGDTVGTTVEELATILASIVAAGVDETRIGFCLDTAHLWGAGHEVSRPDVLDALLADFDRRLGSDQLALLHLNDSRAVLGSRADRHEHIGAGSIGEEGMRTILFHPRLASIPTYFETPRMDEGYDAVNLDRIRCLLAGEPLPELRSSAFPGRRGKPRRGRPKRAREPAPEGT
ncbi:MAG TPA: TIM barrel protein [Candidatus Limnocylindrales bacterium]|jgi:deoxyribonuclease-4|nr:TIM barrel protein [Candidatus Limnocylindrales bacterium]